MNEKIMALYITAVGTIIAVHIAFWVSTMIIRAFRNASPEDDPTPIDYDAMLPHEREQHKQYAWTKHYGGYELTDDEKRLLHLEDQPDDKGDLTVIQRRMNGLNDDEPIDYEAMDSLDLKILGVLARAKAAEGYELTADENRLLKSEDENNAAY